MSARAAAGLLVSALIRRTEASGGNAMVLAKGDAVAGAILLCIAERGITAKLLERAPGMDGAYALIPTGPRAIDDPIALIDYIARRRRNDPDLWVVELDGPGVETIAQEILGG